MKIGIVIDHVERDSGVAPKGGKAGHPDQDIAVMARLSKSVFVNSAE